MQYCVVVVTCWLIWDTFSCFFSQTQICMLLCVLAWMSNVLTNSGIWIFGFKFTVLFGRVEELHPCQRKYITGSGLWELKLYIISSLHNALYVCLDLFAFSFLFLMTFLLAMIDFYLWVRVLPMETLARVNSFFHEFVLAMVFYESNIIVNNTLWMCNLDVIDIEINE